MKPREIQTIAVIGAGKAGREIACAAAQGGYRVVLEDVSHETLQRSMDWIWETQNGSATMQRVATAHSVEEACREGDLLIETVPEELEIKLEIFTLFDKFAKPGAILASHTHSVLVADLAAITFRPELCVGLRFCESGHLEIVRAKKTSAKTVAACREVGLRLGKEVVVADEEPEICRRGLASHG